MILLLKNLHWLVGFPLFDSWDVFQGIFNGESILQPNDSDVEAFPVCVAWRGWSKSHIQRLRGLFQTIIMTIHEMFRGVSHG
jgi:hypothetical protein